MYNYYNAIMEDVIMEDVITWLDDNGVDLSNYLNENMAFDALYDDLFIDDAVTGNASGSYTFNRYKAEENLIGIFELLLDAVNEFGGTSSGVFERGAEHCDVLIRCHLLGECLSDVLKEHY